MKVVSSLKSAKIRDKDNKLVRRKKTRSDGSMKTVVKVINKKKPKNNVSQGWYVDEKK